MCNKYNSGCYLWRWSGLVIENSVFILKQTLLPDSTLPSSGTLTLARHVVSLCFRFFNCTMENKIIIYFIKLLWDWMGIMHIKGLVPCLPHTKGYYFFCLMCYFPIAPILILVSLLLFLDTVIMHSSDLLTLPLKSLLTPPVPKKYPVFFTLDFLSEIHL